MQIHFILIEPEVPENIGAAARAVKTMGFNSLWLVNTQQHLNSKARYVAHGSRDILSNARIFNEFDEMLGELDFSIATTSKSRRVKYDYQPAEKLREIIHSKSGIIRNAGVIFGREEYGLKNEELKKCHIVTFVPMKTTYPSLNLGQSVMLYSYLLSELSGESATETGNAAIDELKALTQKIEIILPALNLPKSTNIYGRIMERLMHVKNDDIHLLHSICNEILKKLNLK